MARKNEKLKIEDFQDEEKEVKDVDKGNDSPKETRKEEQEKEDNKPKPKKKTKENKPFVHIDDFIEGIRPKEDLNSVQVSGFKAYMAGNHYVKDFDVFIPHLEKYLGKKVGK